MAPGSNLSGAYEATSKNQNLKLLIPGPATGPNTRSAAESPDVRYILQLQCSVQFLVYFIRIIW